MAQFPENCKVKGIAKVNVNGPAGSTYDKVMAAPSPRVKALLFS